jgi:hypothetical protein
MLAVALCATGNLRRRCRFGSKADIAAAPINVRFTPESGHRTTFTQLPRWRVVTLPGVETKGFGGF